MLTTLIAFAQGQWIAIAALLVSLTSLAVSVLNYRRDRPKLKITAQFFSSDEAPGYIQVKVVNVGRRPLFLVMLWGKDKSGVGSGSYFDYRGPGIKLGEHEFKTFNVTHLPRGEDDFAAVAMVDDDIVDFHRMWVEDSTGKKCEIPKMKALLRALSADYGKWCERTGYWKPPASPRQVEQGQSDAADEGAPAS